MFCRHFSAMQKREDYVCKQPCRLFCSVTFPMTYWSNAQHHGSLLVVATAQSLKSQLLIITAVGYYKRVKSIPVTADACTTTREPRTTRTKDGGLDFLSHILTSEKIHGNCMFLCLLLSGRARCMDLIRNGGQVVILLLLSLVDVTSPFAQCQSCREQYSRSLATCRCTQNP